VLLGLVIGKPTGVLLGAWAATRTGAASLPAAAKRRQFLGVSVLCGIGFTMSLFVANLVFPGREDLLGSAKVGILAASLVAGVVGGAIVAWAGRGPARSRG
jgi:NhaA family Na+:H+ antiporter